MSVQEAKGRGELRQEAKGRGELRLNVRREETGLRVGSCIAERMRA